MLPHTPGIVVAISGTLDHLSGLTKNSVQSQGDKRLHSLEVSSIFSPYSLVPVDRDDRDEDSLPFLDPVHTGVSNAYDQLMLAFVRHAPDLLPDLAGLVEEGLRDGDNIVFHGNTNRARHSRVHSQRLPGDSVEVWQRVKFVHGWCVCWYTEKLVAELLLHCRELRERIQGPHGRGAGRFVARYQERWNLYVNIHLGEIEGRRVR